MSEITPKRYRALELIADFIREPSRELRLNAIICDVSDEDLRWVTDRLHHYILKLLEQVEYNPDDAESLDLTD